MKSYIKTIRAMLPVLLSVLMLASCAKERESRPGPDDGTGEKTVRFSLRVPGVSNPATRALEGVHEDEVDNVTVLIFNPGTGNVYKHETPTGAIAANGSKRTFEVTLPVGTYDLMVIANANGLIQKKYPNGIARGTTRAAVMESLVAVRQADMPDTGDRTGDKWNTDPLDTEKGYLIPMWGQVSGAVITDDAGTQDIKTVNMYRMVAKIDVKIPRRDKIGTDIITGQNFELTEVTFHNYNTKGCIIPELTNGTDWEKIPNGGKAAKPTLTASSDNFVGGYEKYQKFTQFTEVTGSPDKAINLGGDNTELAGMIYTFEAGKGSTYQDRPCVIIGGKYNESTKTTYYRVDLIKSGTNNEYFDLLRNHRYVIYVKKISGPGYESVEEAYKSAPVNFDAEIIEWNNNIMGDIVFDGTNILSVSQGQFDFTREARTIADEDNYLTITTDVKAVGSKPAGWSAKIYSDEEGRNLLSDGQTEGWLRLSAYSGNGNYPEGNTTRLLADMNDTSQERTAYIHITASRLTYIVTVKHLLAVKLELDILANGNSVTELYFPLANPTAQDFVLKWSPVTESVRSIVSEGGNAFDVAASVPDLTTYVSGNGEQAFTVLPAPYNTSNGDPFFEKSATVTFELPTDEGMVSKTLMLRQMEFNLVPAPQKMYLMDGVTEHKVMVKSNFPWRVQLKTDNKSVIKSFATQQYGGGPRYTEDYFRFRLIENLSGMDMNKLEADITVVFWQFIDGQWVEWTDHDSGGAGVQKEYSVHCMAALPKNKSNSYMINSGNPVPIIFSVGEQVAYALKSPGTSGYLPVGWMNNCANMKAAVYWSDVDDFTTENAVVNTVMYIGSPVLEECQIVVVPGRSNAQGNSLVILYEDNDSNGIYSTGDMIRWSWHIWKTDVYPYSAAGVADKPWLDRNLGATSSVPGNSNACGFHYQWGRKEPLLKILPNSGWSALTSATLHRGPEIASGIQVNATSYMPSIGTGSGMIGFVTLNPNLYPTYSGYGGWTPLADTWGGAGTAGYLHESGKSVYDPCPEGYRVPATSSDFASGWKSDVPDDKGRVHNTFGYYPYAGRSTSATNISYMGTYWFAESGRFLNLTSSEIDGFGNVTLATHTGCTVRCVAE